MRHAIFGTLKHDEEDDSWKTSRKFSSFAPFRQKPYGKRRPPAKHEILIDAVEDADEPSAEQVKAFQWFVKNEAAACRKVIDAIFRYYMLLRKQNRRSFEQLDYPEIADSDELRHLMEFSGLRVRGDQYRKTALLGYSFDCAWDDEHGLGVLAHKNVILDIGGADVAYSAPNSAGSTWLKACTPKEKEAARTILKALRAPSRAPRFPPYQRLEIALIAGDEKKVRELVAKGVDINDVPFGETHALWGAISRSDPKAIKLLLELGANLTVKTVLGDTVLESAQSTLRTLGSPGTMLPPGPLRDRIEERYQRATEVLRLLREAGAE